MLGDILNASNQQLIWMIPKQEEAAQHTEPGL
jgi:hypothetical protein